MYISDFFDNLNEDPTMLVYFVIIHPAAINRSIYFYTSKSKNIQKKLFSMTRIYRRPVFYYFIIFFSACL